MTAAPYTPVSITLGHKTVHDVAKSVINYLESPRTQKRINDYDFAAHQRRLRFTSGASQVRISLDTIWSAEYLMAQLERNLTKYHARVTNKETSIRFAYEWFKKQEETAPWHLVTSTSDFVDANPYVLGADYDAIAELWFHFADGSPKGIGETQINKVLHQLLPNSVPIFDSVLSKLYSGSRLGRKIKADRKAHDKTNILTMRDSFLWEPLRQDMAKLTTFDIANIRQGVAALPCKNALIVEGKAANLWASEKLGLVRLIDMAAWQ